MPITKRNGEYYWGSKGPFDSRKKAAEVAQAAHASGYEGSVEIEKILPALAALGGAAAGAVGAAASAAGPIAGAIGRTAMRSLAGAKLGAGGGGGDEDESGGLDAQDAHAQTEWENIHNSKSIQKLMSFVKAPVAGDDESKWEDPRNTPENFPGKPGETSWGNFEPSTFKNPPDVVHPSSMNIAPYGGRTTSDTHGVSWREKEARREQRAEEASQTDPSPSARERGRRLSDMLRERREQEADVKGMPEYTGDEPEPDFQGPPAFPPSKYEERPKGFHDAIRESEMERQSKLTKPWRVNWQNSVQKLMGFVQIQKLGYQEDEPIKGMKGDELGGIRRSRIGVQGARYAGQRENVMDARPGKGMSAGLPGYGTKEWDRLKQLWDKTGDLRGLAGQLGMSRTFPLAIAHKYLSDIQAGDYNDIGGSNAASTAANLKDYAERVDEYPDQTSIINHLSGHQALADVHNMMLYGEDWFDNPNSLTYMHPDNIKPGEKPSTLKEHWETTGRHQIVGERGWTTMGESIQRPSEWFMDRLNAIQSRGGQWRMPVTLEEFQQQMLPALIEPWKGKHGMGISNQAKGMMDDLHRRLRMESPNYDPNDMRYPKLQDPRHHLMLPPHGPERSTHSTETTPLPGAEEESDNDMVRLGTHDRGESYPLERYNIKETPEGEIRRTGLRQRSGEGREEFDEMYGNPPKYTYDAPGGKAYPKQVRGLTETGETLPYELRTDYPSAKERLEAHGGGEENPLEGTVPPPIPADPRNAFERNRPDLFPPRDKEKAVAKLEKFMRKEGAVGGEGGGFDGLSDTVFTSTNAGIFTPTYGGKGTKKKHNKNHKRQDAKRRKLMGKEKKSGVERLVQYLYDGSPHISKAGKMGLAPGLDESMTGNAPTAHAGRNRVHSPFRQLENSSDLNHKKTSREIEDAIEVAKENEPHISMGQPGGFETGITATLPVKHSSVNSVGNPGNPRAPVWGKYDSYVQKAVPQATTFISPNGNTKAADGQHPQKEFIEQTRDNPNEIPSKDAVIKENDMQRKRKQESNTEPEGSQPVAGLGLQMSSFGMNTYEQDSLSRGGEEDTGHDEEDIDEEETSRIDEDGNMWVPMNPDRTKSLESMRKALEDAGDEAPLLTALHKLDYS